MNGVKKSIKNEFILKALDNGWSVRKKMDSHNTFEFTKNNTDQVDESPNKQFIRRAISTPVTKHTET